MTPNISQLSSQGFIQCLPSLCHCFVSVSRHERCCPVDVQRWDRRKSGSGSPRNTLLNLLMDAVLIPLSFQMIPFTGYCDGMLFWWITVSQSQCPSVPAQLFRPHFFKEWQSRPWGQTPQKSSQDVGPKPSPTCISHLCFHHLLVMWRFVRSVSVGMFVYNCSILQYILYM